MGVGSDPKLSNVILGLKSCFMNLKTQKGLFICPKLMSKAKKFKKQKINSVPFRTTVLPELVAKTENFKVNFINYAIDILTKS